MTDAAGLDPLLAEVLACPACHGPVHPSSDTDGDALTCAACRLAYPVRDGVPVMLTDEARPTEGTRP